MRAASMNVAENVPRDILLATGASVSFMPCFSAVRPIPDTLAAIEDKCVPRAVVEWRRCGWLHLAPRSGEGVRGGAQRRAGGRRAPSRPAPSRQGPSPGSTLRVSPPSPYQGEGKGEFAARAPRDLLALV